MATTVKSLGKVSEHFSVTSYTVRKWRDEEGCPALQEAPYDLDQIATWMDAAKADDEAANDAASDDADDEAQEASSADDEAVTIDDMDDTTAREIGASIADDETVMDVVDGWWQLHEEYCIQARHHDGQRATVAAVSIAITAAVLFFLRLHEELTFGDLPLTLFLTGLGVFGMMFCDKQYERFYTCMTRARKYREAIDGALENASLAELKDLADQDAKKKFPESDDEQYGQFWGHLYVLMAVAGVILTIMVLYASIP